ncbi:MAG: hypothetical protein AVDCRST_MAG53-882 [uncultured Solirubrobacteraceae bacterium]|uniref:Uncharacterized protein n=1 Tax=uncultured Solirubrobacteraceae bacterium TaxID=1162706 RepID=A0A6J4RW10_9ACTN|nr:MAG: hypothetical protein AVDCRST_MAG53-882 [uncultured Solirubrobacteraceae bacterium]
MGGGAWSRRNRSIAAAIAAASCAVAGCVTIDGGAGLGMRRGSLTRFGGSGGLSPGAG